MKCSFCLKKIRKKKKYWIGWFKGKPYHPECISKEKYDKWWKRKKYIWEQIKQFKYKNN
jgi:hypothetical protein